MSSGTKTIINQAQVTYTADPGGERRTETNAVATIVYDEALSVRLKSEVSQASLCQEYEYWLCLTNLSAEALCEVEVTDQLADGLELVPGSVCVDGTAQAEADMAAGICLGTLAAGEFVVVSYRVRVTQKPPQGVVENTAVAAYRDNSGAAGSAVSNTVQVQVQACELLLVALPDQLEAHCGDCLTYSGYVTNTGNFPAENIMLKLTIPPGTELVRGSLLLNGGRPCSPWSCEQIPLGNLSLGQSALFCYQLQVVTRQNMTVSDRAIALYRCAGACLCANPVLCSNAVEHTLTLNPCSVPVIPNLYRE